VSREQNAYAALHERELVVVSHFARDHRIHLGYVAKEASPCARADRNPVNHLRTVPHPLDVGGTKMGP
jgi:hypothetical protein